MGRPWPSAAVLSLLVIACSEGNRIDNSTRDESGLIVEAGEIGVNALRVGDCFNESETMASESAEIVSVEGVPCHDPHDFEVYYLGALPDTEYPGDQTVTDLVLDQCLTVFDEFVGMVYEESQLDFTMIYPRQENWEDDDRGYSCQVYHMEGQKLMGSARGAGY